MCLAVEVTKKNREYMTSAPEDGAVIYGLFMEGKILWNYTFLDNGT